MERPYLILSLRNTYRGNVDFMSVSRVISSTRRKKSIQNQGGGAGGGTAMFCAVAHSSLRCI